MFSTIAGIIGKPIPKQVQKAAAAVDFAAMVTLVVLGALALYGIGGFNLPPGGAWVLVGGGALGLAVLAIQTTVSFLKKIVVHERQYAQY